MKDTTSKPAKSKAQITHEQVLAELDAADAEVPENPQQYEREANGSSSDESFTNLFENFLKEQSFNVGDIVKGIISDVHEDFVLIDINYKSEGMVPKSEFRVVNGQSQIEKGSEVEVYIDRIENENGMVVLSKDKADMSRAWDDISKAAENEEMIEGTIVSKVKGGLSVDIGVTAFLPGSQIDLRPVRNMDIYLGKSYQFKVIKFNKRRGNIVLSRRVILEEERESMRSQTLDNIKEGSTVKGLVKNITDYGAFIDLGGMDGLLHITDMSWGHLKHPSEIISVGDDLEVKILKFDNSKERVSLGLKQLKEDPWSRISSDYPPGKKVKGKVISLTDYGAFIEIEEGIEGLVHVSEMSWVKRIKHPSQELSVDNEVETLVLEVGTENRHLSLSMKQLQPNPWEEIHKNYPPGTIIQGEIKSIIDFGIFINIEEGIDGLVHVSDFSWTKRINHPSEIFTKGQTLKAVILSVDVKSERISLGVKQLEDDPWSDLEAKYGIGTQHEVKVVKTTDFGVFVRLESEIEGLIHISELSTQRVEKPEEVVKVGDSLKAEIINIDKDSRRIGLSAKLITLREQKADVEHYAKKATSTSRTSLGDLFGGTLKSATSTTPPKEAKAKSATSESNNNETPLDSDPEARADSVDTEATTSTKETKGTESNDSSEAQADTDAQVTKSNEAGGTTE